MRKGCRAVPGSANNDVPLSALGRRICILGPSGSGKSTLAVAIGARLGLPVVHLDQLHHLPDSDWVPRPRDAFTALHDAAILGERWVMEGNYTALFPQRIARATGVILIDVPTRISLWRYLRRTLFEQGRRRGALRGERDSVKWAMIRHILGPTRANRRRYAALYDAVTLPKRAFTSPAALARFYAEAGLAR